MSTYLIPVIIFAVLGLAAGILLTAAAKIFYVKTDERIEKIGDSLPQANCGACGYAGCSDYANAIVNGNAPTNLCKPGGTEVSRKISSILGTEVLEVLPETAVVHCRGNCEAVKKRFEFTEAKAGTAAKRFYSGENRVLTARATATRKRRDERAIEIVDGVADVTPEYARHAENALRSVRTGLFQ